MVTWKDIGRKVITPDGIGELIEVDAGAAYWVEIGDEENQYTIEEIRLENDKMPSQVRFILEWLTDAGYESYICGGAVRDYLLGKEPHDYDITTSATPNQVMEVFKHYHVLPTGLQHGTVTIMLSGGSYEVTTFRKDGDYSDSRHPDSVQFTSDIVEDLSRRDFTINAMAYNPEVGLIDPFGGQEDLKNKIIRCVGNPRDRFNEDALRILRAIRFACQLDFIIHPSIGWQIGYTNIINKLNNISVERINSEFVKIIKTNQFNKRLVWNYGVFSLFIPELNDMIGFQQNNPYHAYDVFVHTVHALEKCQSDDLIVRLAVFFHDFGKPHCYQDEEDGFRHFKGHGQVSAEMTDEIMKRLRFDNETRNNVVELVRYHDATFEVGKKYVKRWLNKIGEEQFRRLLGVKKADNKGQNPNYDQERIDKVDKIEKLLEEVLQENECFSLKDLAVNGKDLISIGYHPGKALGNILDKLLQMVIDGTLSNNKEELLKVVKIWDIERKL